MTQDVTAGIGVQIDSRSALDQLRALQVGISQFNQSVIATNSSAVKKQQELIRTFASQAEATKAFSTHIANVETSVGSLGKTIDKGKMSLGQYFSYGAAASGKFNNIFSKQHKEIMGLAEDRVKRLSTQYVALGESANGMTKALAIRPMQLMGADAQIATQRMQLFNKIMSNGATGLINWGKNTQWAGRQLMVGFTVPLTIFGTMAAKAFIDIEKSMVAFKRVYGDTMTSIGETDIAYNGVRKLADEYTKYGIKISDTINLSAKAAAAGFQGQKLTAQTVQATRLATLGQIDSNQALDTTISLQSAFNISSKDLGSTIDFLNAVENQTVTSLDDITTAIPKVAPVIKGLGGDVKDLAVFMTAMREGGVSASQGANALKSSLASLIAPTQKAKDEAKSFGINLESIAKNNEGDLMGMVTSFGDALKKLSESDQQQVLVKVFGKFQFARMGAMFKNLSRDGSQASKVMDLVGASTSSLAKLSESELSKVENAINVKFTGSLERLKGAIAPIGEQFLKIATPILDFATNVANGFNNLNPVLQGFITAIVTGVGVIMPAVTMTVGLFANMFGNIMKFGINIGNMFARFRKGGEDTMYLAEAELDTAAAAASLEGKVTGLTGALAVQRAEVNMLAGAYKNMLLAASSAIQQNPAGFRIGKIKGFAKGRVGMVGGTGNRDSELAALMPGESVVTKSGTQGNQGVLRAINAGAKIRGFADGVVGINGQRDTDRVVMPSNVHAKSEASITKLFAAIEKAGSAAIEEANKAVAELSAKGKVSTAKVVAALNQSANQQVRDIAKAQLDGTRYKAPENYRLRAANFAKTEDGARLQQQKVAIEAEMAKNWKNVSAAQMGGMTNVQSAHLTKQTNAAGQKMWQAGNLTPDNGAINQYLNRVEQIAQEIPRDSKLMLEMSKLAGLSLEDFVAEMDNFEKGWHPATQKAIQAMNGIATLDEELSLKLGGVGKTALGTNASSGYLAAGTRVATQTSLNTGNVDAFYAKGKAAYNGLSPMATGAAVEVTKLAEAAGKKLVEAATAGLAAGMAQAGATVGKAAEVLGVHSPAKAVTNLSDGVLGGAVIASGQLSEATKILTSAVKRTGTVGSLREGPVVAAGSGGISQGKFQGIMSSVSALSMALSFVPGQVGEFSQNLMMASMGLQAFSGVGALLKGTRIAAAFTPLLSAGPLAAGALGALVSPAGLVIAGLAAVAGVAWLVYDAYQRQQKHIKELGEAAKFSADAIQGMGAALNFTPRTSGFGVKASDTSVEGRTQAATAQSYIKDNPDTFKTQIDVAKNASKAEASTLFNSMFMDLMAQGAPVKVANSIIEQISTLAGKHEIFVDVAARVTKLVGKDGKVDFKQMSKDLGTKLSSDLNSASTKGLADQGEKLKKLNAAKAESTRLSELSAKAQKKYDEVLKDQSVDEKDVTKAQKARDDALSKANDATYAASIAQNELSDATGATKDDTDKYARTVAASSASITSYMQLVSAEYASGKITADEYKKSMDLLAPAIDKMGAAGQETLRGAMTPMLTAFPALNDQAATFANGITDSKDMLNLLRVAGSGDQGLIDGVNAQLAGVAAAVKDGNMLLAPQTAEYQRLMATLSMGPAVIPDNPNASKISALEAQLTAAQGQKPAGAPKKSSSGGGGGAPKQSKYDKKSDKIAKANARLDLAEVKIDKTEDKKIQNALTKRFGSMTFEISGLKITMKNAADVEYAMQQIDETIEDINRNQIDPLNDKLDDLNDKQDEINRKAELYQQEIDKVNEAFDKQLKPIEASNAALQDQSDTLEAQRDSALNGVELQITALENQIAIADFAAQQQISMMDTQIEKNTASKDLIDLQVQAIDDQIAALQEVQDLNDIIADQQRAQLDLASALSTGDAGAAASAMMGAQSTSASSSSKLQTKGLEASKSPLEGQSKTLDDQNSLLEKRKDAIQKGVDALNRQLDSLNQQKTLIENSYKVELQAISDIIAKNAEHIRQLEVQRDVQVSTWQKLIDDFAPALRDLTNEIWGYEKKIKDIQDQKIKPLEKQKALLEDILGDVKDQISREKAIIDAKRKQLDYDSKVNNAMKTLKGTTSSVGSAAKTAAAGMYSAWKGNIDKIKGELNRLKAMFKIKYTFVNNKTGREVDYTGNPPKSYFDTKNWFLKNAVFQHAARGGILPGFRGVAMGDNVPTMLRSGEGVTVSEALTNKYESKRLLALNKAALSGNMAGFYDKYSMPSFSIPNDASSIKPVSSDNSSTVYNEYRVEVHASSPSSADDIANTVITKIKGMQQGQLRSY